ADEKAQSATKEAEPAAPVGFTP
nr:PSI-D1=19.3 kda photosystem I psaD product {N-terminal} [Nicotiana tabacum, leaves, Peptide Chloroplast Partial, 22 aa] [Nicotiana tabacum]